MHEGLQDTSREGISNRFWEIIAHSGVSVIEVSVEAKASAHTLEEGMPGQRETEQEKTA